MKFGDEFKLVQDMELIYRKIGIGEYAPEYFLAYDDHGRLEYCIMDDAFGQPSPANNDSSDYAKLMRWEACKILIDLLNQEIIEPINQED